MTSSEQNFKPKPLSLGARGAKSSGQPFNKEGKVLSRFQDAGRSKETGKDGRSSSHFKSGHGSKGFSSKGAEGTNKSRFDKARSDKPRSDRPRPECPPRGAAEKIGRVFNKQLAGNEPVAGLEFKQERTAVFNENKERRSSEHKHATPSKRSNNLRTAIGSQSRAAAAQILEAVAQGKSLGEAIPMYCHHLEDRDTAFVKEIVYGTLRQRRLLMNTVQPMIEHKIPERHRVVQYLLISAMYQLVFLQSPPHAVVSATVSACGDCGHKTFAPMVNAILRRFLRENMQLAHSDNLAVEYSFPDWLYNRIEEAYPEQVKQVLEGSNTKPPLILRVENSKISTHELLERLAANEMGASLVASELSQSAIVLDVATNVSEIAGFAEGLCSVQDLSAQLAAPLLELEDDSTADNTKNGATSLAQDSNSAEDATTKNSAYTEHLNKLPKLRVLDCCCAPGGKTAHIMDLNPNCEVTALDVDFGRLQQTKATLERLGREATLKVLDAQDLSSLAGLFDRILVDAPCSGTGVIRRHPDIKWLRREKDIENLTAIQAKILDEAFAKLAPNGILLYTTCSILPEENIKQVEAFLERHKDATLKPFTLGGKEYQTLQRLPGDNNGDGFFYAKIVKTASLQ